MRRDEEPSLKVEDELAEILRSAKFDQRQSRALSARLGWDGKGGRTLAEAGQVGGYTRERVRQLEDRLQLYLEKARPSIPLVKAAVKALQGIAPTHRRRGALKLLKEGLARERFDPAGIINAARMMRLSSGVAIIGEGLVPEGSRSDLERVRKAARKLVSVNGAGSVAAMIDRLANMSLPIDRAFGFVELAEKIKWLDAKREWFFIPVKRNRAENYLRKMFSVAKTLTLEDLREGLRRPGRAREINLPRHVLSALFKKLGWIDIDGETATSLVDLDYRKILERTERTIVEVFRTHGPVLDRQTVLDLAAERSLDRTTVGLYLGWSPIIQRIAVNRYALIGAEIPAGTLEAMRSAPSRQRVQQDYGWTSEGWLRIRYRLSQPVVDSGVIGIPGAVRDILRGRFRFAPPKAYLGELSADGTHLWGLPRLRRESGAEAGDALVLEFDLASRTCRASVGGAELLETEDRDGERTTERIEGSRLLVS
jgi:hypothetical protein